MFDLFTWMWSVIQPILFVTAWLIPTWFTAYLVKVTAPQVCPKGATYQHCFEEHGPTHVVRNHAGWALGIGVLWPATWLYVLYLALRRSLDVAVAVTPMPKPKVSLDPAITSGEKTTEELLNEIEEVHEGTVVQHWEPPNGGTR